MLTDAFLFMYRFIHVFPGMFSVTICVLLPARNKASILFAPQISHKEGMPPEKLQKAIV